MLFSGAVIWRVEETAVLDCEDVEVARERIGVDVEDRLDSVDLDERLVVPELRLVERPASAPSRSTSHLHLHH
jgi:hypothetical protein